MEKKYEIHKKVYYSKTAKTNVSLYYLSVNWKGTLRNIAEVSVFKESWKNVDLLCRIPKHLMQKVLYLCDLRVSNSFQRKGYGKTLLKEILKRYKEEYDIIHLDAKPSSFYTSDTQLKEKELINFYESVGFKIYKKREDYTTMVFKTSYEQ